MNKPVTDLTGLKVGDTVFVVHQRQRHRELQTEEGVIDRVGTKYAYLKRGQHWSMPFCKKTGISVHDRDSNARSNGYGFDVYRKKEDWLLVNKTAKELARLKPRLVDSWGRPHPFSLDVVMKIHAILDAEGLD